MIVISDTTPIISFLKAQKLDLLQKLYKNVVIPEAVYNESQPYGLTTGSAGGLDKPLQGIFRFRL